MYELKAAQQRSQELNVQCENISLQGSYLRSSIQKYRAGYKDRQIGVFYCADTSQDKTRHKQRSAPCEESRHSPAMILTIYHQHKLKQAAVHDNSQALPDMPQA
jgi:hypothetical protein